MAYVGINAPLVRLRSRAILEKAMQARDVNGTELARNAGVAVQTVSNLRRGKSTRTQAPVAAALARALNVKPSDLFDDAEIVDNDDAPEYAS